MFHTSIIHLHLNPPETVFLPLFPLESSDTSGLNPHNGKSGRSCPCSVAAQKNLWKVNGRKLLEKEQPSMWQRWIPQFVPHRETPKNIYAMNNVWMVWELYRWLLRNTKDTQKSVTRKKTCQPRNRSRLDMVRRARAKRIDLNSKNPAAQRTNARNFSSNHI